MSEDPIVQETRLARSEVVEQFGDDMHAFFEHLRAREATEKQGMVVSLAPNPADPALEGVGSR